MFVSKFNEYFPKKNLKISNDDQPWMSQKLKKLDRQRKRIYHKNRRSPQYEKLNKDFKKEIKSAKTNFYRKMVQDLKEKDPGQWYKAVKRMTSSENHNEPLQVDKKSHLTNVWNWCI